MVQDLHDRDAYRNLKKSIVKKLHWEPKKPRRKWHILEVINQSAISLLAVGLPSITHPYVTPKGDLLRMEGDTSHEDNFMVDQRSFEADINARTTILGLQQDEGSISELPIIICGNEPPTNIPFLSTIIDCEGKRRSNIVENCFTNDSTLTIDSANIGEEYVAGNQIGNKNSDQQQPITNEKIVTLNNVILPSCHHNSGGYSPLLKRKASGSAYSSKSDHTHDYAVQPSNVKSIPINIPITPYSLEAPDTAFDSHLSLSEKGSPRLKQPQIYLDRNSPRNSRIMYGVSPRAHRADREYCPVSAHNKISSRSLKATLETLIAPVHLSGESEGAPYDTHNELVNFEEQEKIIQITCV